MSDASDYLAVVKKAVRVKASAYDDELLMYIDTVLAEFERLGIPTSPESMRKSCVVAFIKANFGMNSPSDKAEWMQVYDRLLRQLVLRGW